MSDSINESLAASVVRLGNECRDLAISNAVLRQDNDELHKDYESLADEHTKLIERNKTLKAEVERLRKAGDDLITALDKRDDVFDNSDKRDAINAWNAAKEGNQP